MSSKKEFCVTRVPCNDWDNILETVTLDGSYSEEIKSEVWTAIENMEDFSDPWVVIIIEKDNVNAKIFREKESALKYVSKLKKRSSPPEQIFCTRGQYQSSISS